MTPASDVDEAPGAVGLRRLAGLAARHPVHAIWSAALLHRATGRDGIDPMSTLHQDRDRPRRSAGWPVGAALPFSPAAGAGFA